MIIPSKKIKSDLKSIWPMLGIENNQIIFRSSEYPVYESIEELEDVVNKCIEKYIDDPPGYECEFRADQLMSSVWKYDYKFFGIALGVLFRDRPGNHTLNIARVNSDFYFIDPKDSAIWLGDKVKDRPYFVWR